MTIHDLFSHVAGVPRRLWPGFGETHAVTDRPSYLRPGTRDRSHITTHSLLFAVSLVLSPLLTSCATRGAPNAPVTGRSGPVQWELVNVGRLDSLDGRQSRWSYTVVLKETTGTDILFERVERGSYVTSSTILVGGAIQKDVFDQRLAANGELRYHTAHTWGWSQSTGTQFGGLSRLGSLTVEQRFIGKDARGNVIAVPVRAVLDRSFGELPRRPLPSTPLPPAKVLQPGDLQSLAGKWTGYYEVPGFRIPLEATVEPGGSVDIGEHEPVTNHFRATLSIRDGQVWYSARETGSLTLHEGAGRRVLVGQITRQGPGGAPAMTYSLRLDAVGPFANTASGALRPPPTRAPAANGTWAAPRGNSGTVSARLINPIRVDFHLNESHPPEGADFDGRLHRIVLTSPGRSG